MYERLFVTITLHTQYALLESWYQFLQLYMTSNLTIHLNVPKYNRIGDSIYVERYFCHFDWNLMTIFFLFYPTHTFSLSSSIKIVLFKFSSTITKLFSLRFIKSKSSLISSHQTKLTASTPITRLQNRLPIFELYKELMKETKKLIW